MKNWRNGNVITAKGARTPRESPNHSKKEKQDGQRELLHVLGRDTQQVTRRQPCRRGSRLRKDETWEDRKILRGGGSWEDEGYEEPRKVPPDSENATIHNLEEFRRKKGGSSTPQEPLPEETSEESKPRIWTLDDFSDEARAADEKRRAALEGDFDTQRRNRREMEVVFQAAEERKQAMYRAAMGGGRVNPTPPKAQEETPYAEAEVEERKKTSTSDCVHHLDLSGVGGKAPKLDSTPRPRIGSSHKSGPSRKKRKP